ncbi:hypothetical protein RJ55_01783 [Drechmeria coniospora]|nr:hypothetical protein RJ55_01783 [Drechmeria coniospora]
MKRRCPNSRYIGHARLSRYRWQINQRGYANVVAVDDDGRWVDGLVYEIDETDEAKLDVNEGVSKNAYEKRYLPILLHRASGTLYRRPVSWIVSKGGPAAVCRQAKCAAQELLVSPGQQRHDDALVYISFRHVEDSVPKEEYIDRINLGLADASVLGMKDDYIRNCIRPYIPGPVAESALPDGNHGMSSTKAKVKPENIGVKRGDPPESHERPLTRRAPDPGRPPDERYVQAMARTIRNNASVPNLRRRLHELASPPPRPLRRLLQVPTAVTLEDYASIEGWEWRSVL